ncbi:hypothetical protein QTP88_022622 [Uroleucon formosanum]
MLHTLYKNRSLINLLNLKSCRMIIFIKLPGILLRTENIPMHSCSLLINRKILNCKQYEYYLLRLNNYKITIILLSSRFRQLRGIRKKPILSEAILLCTIFIQDTNKDCAFLIKQRFKKEIVTFSPDSHKIVYSNFRTIRVSNPGNVVVDDPHADNNYRAPVGGAGDRRNADDGCRVAATAACLPASFKKQCAAEWFMYGRTSAGLGSIRCRDCRMVTRIADALYSSCVYYNGSSYSSNLFHG